MTPSDFLQAMMALASQFDFRETSGYRSDRWNSDPSIGGVPYSSHRFWVGKDIVLWHKDENLKFIEAARRVGIKALDEGTHIHCQPLDWEAG